MESAPLAPRQAWKEPAMDNDFTGLEFNADGMPVIDSVPIRRGSYAVRITRGEERRSSMPLMPRNIDTKGSSSDVPVHSPTRSSISKKGSVEKLRKKESSSPSVNRFGANSSLGFASRHLSPVIASLPEIRRIPIRRGSYAQLFDSKKHMSDSILGENDNQVCRSELQKRSRTVHDLEAPGTAPSKARYSEIASRRISTALPVHLDKRRNSHDDVPSTAPAKVGVLAGRKNAERPIRRSPESWVRPETSQAKLRSRVRTTDDAIEDGRVIQADVKYLEQGSSPSPFAQYQSMPRLRRESSSPNWLKGRSSSNLEQRFADMKESGFRNSTSQEQEKGTEGYSDDEDFAEDEPASQMLSELRDQLKEKEKNTNILVKRLVKTMRALDLEKKKNSGADLKTGSQKEESKPNATMLKMPVETVIASFGDVARSHDTKEHVMNQLVDSIADLYRGFLLLEPSLIGLTGRKEDAESPKSSDSSESGKVDGILHGWSEWIVTQLRSPFLAQLQASVNEEEEIDASRIACRIRQSWEWQESLEVAPAGLCSWDLDIARYGPEIEHLLVDVSLELFEDFGVISDLGVDRTSLKNFISAVARQHGSMLKIPYHNFLRSFDVLHTCYMLLTESGVSTVLNKLDVFSLFLAAVTIDMRHSGTNNMALVTEESQTALECHDQSVLEKSRLAEVFRLINSDDCAILATLNEADCRYVRRMLTATTLATDLSKYVETLSNIRSRMRTGIALSKDSMLDHLVIINLMMITANNGWALKPFELSNEWAELMTKEILQYQEDSDSSGSQSTAPYFNHPCVADQWPSDISEQTRLVSSLAVLLQHNIVRPLTEALRDVLPELEPFDYVLDRNQGQWLKRLSFDDGDEPNLSLVKGVGSLLPDGVEDAIKQKAQNIVEGIVRSVASESAVTDRDGNARLDALAKDSEDRLKRMEKLVRKQEEAEQKRERDRQTIGGIALSVKKAQSDKIMEDARRASVLGKKIEENVPKSNSQDKKEEENKDTEQTKTDDIAAKNWLSSRWEAVEEQKRRHEVQKSREMELRRWRKKAKKMEIEFKTKSENMEKSMSRMQNSVQSKQNEVDFLRRDVARLQDRLSAEVQAGVEREAERGRKALIEQETNLKRRLHDWQKRFKVAESKADAVAEMEGRFKNEVEALTKKLQEANDRIKYEKSQRAIKEVSAEKQSMQKISSLTASLKEAENRIRMLQESKMQSVVMSNVEEESTRETMKLEYEDQIRNLKYKLQAAEKQSDKGLAKQLEVKNNVIRKLEGDLEEQSRVVDQWMVESGGVPTVAEEKDKEIENLKKQLSAAQKSLKKSQKKAQLIEDKLKWEKDSTSALRTKLRQASRTSLMPGKDTAMVKSAVQLGPGSDLGGEVEVSRSSTHFPDGRLPVGGGPVSETDHSQGSPSHCSEDTS